MQYVSWLFSYQSAWKHFYSCEELSFFSIKDLIRIKESFSKITLLLLLNQKELISFPNFSISTLQEIADILQMFQH